MSTDVYVYINPADTNLSKTPRYYPVTDISFKASYKLNALFTYSVHKLFNCRYIKVITPTIKNAWDLSVKAHFIHALSYVATKCGFRNIWFWYLIMIITERLSCTFTWSQIWTFDTKAENLRLVMFWRHTTINLSIYFLHVKGWAVG